MSDMFSGYTAMTEAVAEISAANIEAGVDLAKNYRECVQVFAEKSAQNAQEGAVFFENYVRNLQAQANSTLDRAFELAVLNVGAVLWGRILAPGTSPSIDENRRHPNVGAALKVAGSHLNPNQQ